MPYYEPAYQTGQKKRKVSEFQPTESTMKHRRRVLDKLGFSSKYANYDYYQLTTGMRKRIKERSWNMFARKVSMR